MPVFNNLREVPRKLRLFGLAQRLEIDPQLLALLIEVAALQAESPGYIGHVEVVLAKLPQQYFLLERFGAFGQCANGIRRAAS